MSRQQPEIQDRGPEGTKEPGENSAIKPIQVAAAALAAITAAFLGSSLGVYGTVLGAGLISVATTVGSEIYLRSLRRTREAARRARLGTVRIDPRTRPQGTVLVEQRSEQPPQSSGRFGKLRWPLIVGTSALAFVIGMLVLTGFELTTGKSVSGGEGSTVGRIVEGGGGDQGSGGQGSEQPDRRSAETDVVVPSTAPSESPGKETSDTASTETSTPESSAPTETSQPSQTPTSATPSSQPSAPPGEPSEAEPPGGE